MFLKYGWIKYGAGLGPEKRPVGEMRGWLGSLKPSLCFKELFTAAGGDLSTFLAVHQHYFCSTILIQSPAIRQTKRWKFLRLPRTRMLTVEEMERL
ncbi:MAG: hypothetical protein CW344_10305 [Parageobacillus thermoglucosidasius]|nr:hypothetical protein [Parageobacillus thermoglucosidasius]